MTSIFHYRLHFPHLAKYRNIAHFKRLTFNLHLYAFPCSAYHFPCCAPYICYNDADARCGFIHDLEAARSYGCEDDTSLRQNHQPQERRGGQFGKWIVRLIRNRARFRKQFTLLWGRIEEKQSKPFLRAEYIVLNVAGKSGSI